MNVLRHFCQTIVLVVLVVTGPASADAWAQDLVYLVRHAERADQGAAAGQMLAPTDPPLSELGEARARRLATMLAESGVTAVFATEYRRTQDTAKPLADRLGLNVQVIAAAETDALIARLRTTHVRDVVLVVGHSNTVPAIIRELGGPAVTIAENDHDNLFVVIPASGTLSRIKY